MHTSRPPNRLPRPARLDDLAERPREIFRQLVESFLDTGQPIGSRTLTQMLPMSLSAATIRNTMADLEQRGLLAAPHTSAGRLPTDAGLRLFVDGLLEGGDFPFPERSAIESQLTRKGRSVEDVLTEVSTMLSDFSRCAGLVMVQKQEAPLKHIEFVPLSPGRAIVVLVTEDGNVENRVITVPPGVPPASFVEAANYLNARLRGRTLDAARRALGDELVSAQRELDEVSARLVETGLATWTGDAGDDDRRLIVRGTSNLLEDVTAIEDLERVRLLLDDLEQMTDVVKLVELSREGQGVRIYIGSETKLFSMSGSSVIVAPYMNGRQQVVGALGVIGPTRLNYARIVPMVDFTARLVSRLLSDG